MKPKMSPIKAYDTMLQLETSLPGFGSDNWQSTIYEQVAVYEIYRDLIL